MLVGAGSWVYVVIKLYKNITPNQAEIYDANFFKQ